MRIALAAVLLVAVVSCGGRSSAASNTPLLTDPCGYLSKADFQQTLGLPMDGYRAGQSCGYRDAHGDTCQVTVLADTGAFAASQAAASKYGTVEVLGAGDESFYSAQLQAPGVWIFDPGLTKGTAFASALCGARLGSSNPKPQVARLGDLIASRL